MYPNITWGNLMRACIAGDWTEAKEHASALVDWLARGGFPPRILQEHSAPRGDALNRHLALAGCVFARSHGRAAPDPEDTYDGWSNYETWAVHWCLTSEQDRLLLCQLSATEARTRAPACPQVQDGTWDIETAAVFLLADHLKSWVEAVNPLSESPSVFADLLSAALEDVKWNEIARDLLASSQNPSPPIPDGDPHAR